MTTSKKTRTTNGMKALTNTSNELVDLFFKAGSARGQDLTQQFTTAFSVEPDLAVRLALWVRDARGGAGERQMGRDFLKSLENDKEGVHLLLTTNLLQKLVELGRWDDLLVFTNPSIRHTAVMLIKQALDKGDGLCAKWMPRKGLLAAELRIAFGWTPKFYRKRLVELTNVVESKMCANEWDEINFNHVPSLAMARYKKAFRKNAPDAFIDYTGKLTKGDPKTKVNAGAVFPYDVIKGLNGDFDGKTKEELALIDAQWKALPNFMDGQQVLPLVDVSGSMTSPEVVSGLSPLDVALSLGLYCSDKNTGPFKDTFMTFSTSPELIRLKGTVSEKLSQMVKSSWTMSTNLHAAFDKILELAVKNTVPQSGMPHALLILSDMQFNSCTRFDDSAMQMIRRKYENAGYKVPAIVFWCINAAYNNVPVKHNEVGAALVSGFSPSIMKAVLSADFDSMTPRAVMLKTLNDDRYNYAEAA
jgi:hypothetical protein